jgi:hypothetical protein
LPGSNSRAVDPKLRNSPPFEESQPLVDHPFEILAAIKSGPLVKDIGIIKDAPAPAATPAKGAVVVPERPSVLQAILKL